MFVVWGLVSWLATLYVYNHVKRAADPSRKSTPLTVPTVSGSQRKHANQRMPAIYTYQPRHRGTNSYIQWYQLVHTVVPTRTYSGTNSYTVVPTRTQWYQLIHSGTNSYTVVPTHTQWYQLIHCVTNSYTVVPTHTQ